MDLFNKLIVDPNKDTTLARQLTQQLTWMIAIGDLKSGDQLPPVRDMADRLGINLHTVRSAYQKLEEERLVEIRQGRGTHVLPYDFHRFAKAADAQRSHTIGVIIPTWENPFYHAFMQGVEQITEQDQSLLFLCNSHDDLSVVARDFARLSAKQVDGILVASADINDLAHAQILEPGQTPGMSVVTVDWPDSAGFSVNIDLTSAGYYPTRHMIEHGHQRIALITNNFDAPNITPINQGYQKALQEAGIPFDPALVIRVGGFDLESGTDGGHRFLSIHERPTAVFAINDLLAMGAMRVFKGVGLRIPDDIAVVGFNDIPAAALVDPPLTTASIPGVQLGREAMLMLKALISGDQPPQRHLTLPTSLVIRKSCGAHDDSRSGS